MTLTEGLRRGSARYPRRHERLTPSRICLGKVPRDQTPLRELGFAGENPTNRITRPRPPRITADRASRTHQEPLETHLDR